MKYLGDYAEDSVVNLLFTTHDKDGAAVAPSSAFENSDIRIYKNGSATQKTTVNGITMTSPFDAVVGLHLVAIDTSVDTGDVGFWATGGEYIVVLVPDETVDAEIVVSVIGSFSIERTGGAIQLAKDIPTNAEFALRSLPAADYTIVSDLGVVQTGDSFARIGALGVGLTSVALSTAGIDAILDDVVEGTLTLRHIVRILLSYMAGRATGGGTVTVSFRDQANTKNRIVMTVNADGDRSNVVVDGT